MHLKTHKTSKGTGDGVKGPREGPTEQNRGVEVKSTLKQKMKQNKMK